MTQRTLLSEQAVAIVVPVHNALDHVQRALASVIATCPRSPLVVVDDCSEAETHEWMAWFLGCAQTGGVATPRQLLRNERQQLFTRTVNRGIRWVHQSWLHRERAAIRFVAVVNSDCVLADNWLKGLLLGMEEERVGLVGFNDCADGREPALREQRERGFVAGHCMLLRMAMLEEIGVLCETDMTGVEQPELGPYLGLAHYGSDRELCWRANRAGWRTLDCHYQLCGHARAGSSIDAHDWLRRFRLEPLWTPCDRLDHPTWVDPEIGSLDPEPFPATSSGRVWP